MCILWDFIKFACLTHQIFKIMTIVKKELPLYVCEPSEDLIGYAIAELYCNEDGSDWGYCTLKDSRFNTKEDANIEVKRLMDEAGIHAYQKVNWSIE